MKRMERRAAGSDERLSEGERRRAAPASGAPHGNSIGAVGVGSADGPRVCGNGGVAVVGRGSSRRPLAKMTSNANGVGCSTHAPPRSSLPSARPCWLSRHTKMPFPRSKLNHRRVLNNADELEFLRALISQPSISGYNKE